ncbi:DUF1249 domain-containing protein [Thalassotalea profundi]|nr:DUF1249 domain-containing protein [Thalassotalea profundi]
MMILRLLADKEHVGEERDFLISDFLRYRIKVDEVTRYTSLITMTQNTTVLSDTLPDILKPKMVVRLYHDAKMAEVISNQDISKVKPRYDYPNKKMHLPDEKQQINLFLKEWLQLSLQLGRSSVTHHLYN